MKLTNEQTQKLLCDFGIWITEACDKCGQLLGSSRLGALRTISLSNTPTWSFYLSLLSMARCREYGVDIIWSICHIIRVRWTVELADEFGPEFDALHEDVRTEILALSLVLEEFGTTVGAASC
jgi:hypothetical protein